METRSSKLCLTDLDRNILKHVQQNGMTTFEVLRRVFFPDKSDAALKSNLRRLCGQNTDSPLLRSAPLTGKYVYYYLTAHGTKYLGCTRDSAGPLGPQARYHRFAVLQFLHGDAGRNRTKIDPSQFQDTFPLQGHRLNRNDFFIEDTNDRPKLGSLIVDHGAHPRRIVDKTLQRLALFFRKHWFDEFINDRTFNVTVLTYSEGQKGKILPLLRQGARLCLNRKNRNGLNEKIQWVEFDVVVIPTLQELLPGS